MQLNDPTLLKTRSYINGQWMPALSEETFTVYNPADGERIADVASVGISETELAIAAAEKALRGWQEKTADERAKLLCDWYHQVVENRDDLARIMTLEQGKALVQSQAEISYSASCIEWFAAEAKRLFSESISHCISEKRPLTVQRPLGVVAAVTRWNIPNALIAGKAAPALAVGCTIVIQPASETPLLALAMVALAERVGIPAGVINVVTGSAREIATELRRSSVVRKVTVSSFDRQAFQCGLEDYMEIKYLCLQSA